MKRQVLRAAALACVWCAAFGTAAQARFDFQQTPTVLPKAVVPSHYELWLDLDPQMQDFGGRVRTTVTVREPVSEVLLHADQLRLRTGWLAPAPEASPARQFERLTLRPARKGQPAQTWALRRSGGGTIAPGRYDLELHYRGRIQRSGEGLFRADHRVSGKPATMLATQLQAVQGRKLWPHFDEPVFRASVDLSVRAPQGWQVLGNMPLVSSTDQGGAVLHRFAPTPAMPSYLLAVAVGRFDVLEGQAEGVPLRIFTPPGQRENARYAMDVTQRLLPFYNRYFGVPYSLPKLDQVAVPGTRNGAMEDWGLISYIEDGLLFDPARSGVQQQRGIFRLVAHEVAHQWFGNLVSVASWDEIWLNEAFATWMEGKTAEHFHPEWQSVASARGWVERTMERDATDATRAIRSGSVREDRVFDVFDGITYSKGGGVLSMLEQWVGEANFQKGLAAYMAERRMKSATAGDLWHHVGAAVNLPVAQVAASWTDQPGFPLVSLRHRCEGGQTIVEAQQQRFRLLPTASAPTAVWRIPLRLARGERQDTVLLDAPQGRFTLPGCSTQPLVGNAGGRGFYRMRYDAAERQALAAALPRLGAVDRNILLADSNALVHAGQQSLAEHLVQMAEVPKVSDAGRAPLFSTTAQQLRAFDGVLNGTPAQAVVREAAQRLLAPELQSLGWQPAAQEDPERSRLRPLLIETLAALGDAAVAKAARERFDDALRNDAASVHPSVRAAVLQAAAHSSEPAVFDALWRAAAAAERQEERWVMLQALAAQPTAAQAQRLLASALGKVWPDDVALELPGLVARHPAHAAAAYDFTRRHWQALAAKAGSGVFGARQELLPDAAAGGSDATLVQRLLDDQARLAGPTCRMSAERAAARIQVRAALREREGGRL
jgi:aminopeptidase N